MQEYLIVGTIVKPQGIKGEVKVQPHTDDPERFHSLKTAYREINGEMLPLKVTAARLREGFAYLMLDGVTDRDQAETLRDVILYVKRSDSVKLPKNRWFIVDLVGLKVVDTEGNELGTLKEVLQPGATDVYSVVGPRSFLFPALKRVIKNVDIEAGLMVLDAAALQEVAVYDD